MKQLWLEKMAEDGLIRKEALPHIYKEVEETMKMAEASVGSLTSSQASSALSQLLGSALIGGAIFGYKHLKNKNEIAKGMDMLTKSKSTVLGQYKDSEELGKAQARFDEIARYAPHVAMNAPLVGKIIRANLHSGISDETAQRLAMIQSSYSNSQNDLSKQQSFFPKSASTQVRPEVVGEMIADLYIMEKSAAMFTTQDLSKFLKTVAVYSAVPLVSGLLSGVATAGWSKLKENDIRKGLNDSYNTAVRQAPETHREIFQQDPARTRQTFDALAHFAPSVAMQPHAARTFMKKMLDYYDQGGMNVTDVKELTEIEKNISSASKPKPFSKGFDAGSRFGGTLNEGVRAGAGHILGDKIV